MTPPKVAIVLNSFESDGPGHQTLEICRVLKNERLAHPALFAFSRGGPLEADYSALGLSPRVVPTRGPAGFLRLRKWADAIAASRTDVVHTNLAWPDLAVRLVASRLRGVPLVSTCHGVNLKWDKPLALRLPYDFLDRSTRSRCGGWIAVSESVRRDMIADGFAADRIRVIHNGVDPERFAPLSPSDRLAAREELGVAEHDTLLLAAGSLRHLKGCDTLLRALRMLVESHPATRLLVFGDGPERAALQALAADLGLQDRVGIRPPTHHLPRYMAAADIFVHAARHEAYGLVVAEAQACGTPVVATCVGGVPEVLEDGKTGLLVPPENPGILAEAIGRLVVDDPLRHRLGAAARPHIVGHHDIRRTAREYARFWHDIARRGPIP